MTDKEYKQKLGKDYSRGRIKKLKKIHARILPRILQIINERGEVIPAYFIFKDIDPQGEFYIGSNGLADSYTYR